MTNTIDKLEKIIMKIMETEDPIKGDADLSRQIGMESIEIVELFVEIEKAFGVKMPESMFAVPKTLHSLADYIEQNKKK